ncbi:hypothetical protein P154DRAFT_432586 [Amniculicola lignicola CBS 123094]|uniref:Uncharacterized protein n=1 Tax=Amniculicola lignicola CBS 123094 TaxID=1392246 RepID=A0A6A5WL47_9PLEO|nr:hypothetical protein P154DRAFT_432586 [Amniculicola lignicola CBS 123094]
MGNWFGNLSIAYKYTVVFMSLLGLTIIAGGFKVLYNRHMLRKYAKAQKDVETGREEVVELNAREKDEGDLFGVRAIEAGFTAGIAQSRPTSRASSFVGTSSTSTNTLVGGFYSPKILTHSPATSINSIGLSLGHDGNNSEGFGAKRASPPVSKLLPSDAELNGRINHNAAVNMSLTIPPSPVHSRDPSSPALPGEGDNDGNVSPRSLPRAPRFNHYTPARSKVPMQEAPQVSVHAPEDMSRSPSPPHAPEANMPRMPAKALGDGHRLAFPANSSLRR